LLFVCEKPGGAQSIQIWINDRNNGFKLSLETDLPKGAGPLSFADIDGDGSTDIIFPVCTGTVCTVHVVHNQQMGLCSKSQNSSGSCRSAQHLCIADPNFTFDFSKPNSKDYIVFDIDAYLDDKEHIRMYDSNFRGKLPIPIRAGDYNLDSYPDLLVTTSERVVLLQSVLCDSLLCSSSAQKAGKRSFSVVTAGTEVLNTIANPSQAAFFDIDEDVGFFYLIFKSSFYSFFLDLYNRVL
jgi:integrin alpha FG-GAP repeat containing protein 1